MLILTRRNLTYAKGYAKGLAQVRQHGDSIVFINGGMVATILWVLWTKIF